MNAHTCNGGNVGDGVGKRSGLCPRRGKEPPVVPGLTCGEGGILIDVSAAGLLVSEVLVEILAVMGTFTRLDVGLSGATITEVDPVDCLYLKNQ